jgi:N6-adenosine-specific RNA methylase IME4
LSASSTWPFGSLRMFFYDVIVADPPWDFENYSEAGTKKGADPHYDVMPLVDIKALPVGHLGHAHSIVLLWSIAPMLLEALDTLTAWGAKYLSQIVWRKVTRHGRVRVGTGYRVRSGHELVLLASFGGRQHHAAFSSIFDGLAREHSRKPDEFYKIIADKTPGQNRCDLFSRQTRRGFDGWGNEAGKFDAPEQRMIPPRDKSLT